MPTSLGISGGSRWRIRGWNGGLSMRTVIDCAWMLNGATKDHVLALSLASRILSYGESIRVETELIRWANLYVKNEFLRKSNRLSSVWGSLRIDSTPSESIPLCCKWVFKSFTENVQWLHLMHNIPLFYKFYTVTLGVRGVKRTRCLAYGNSGPSGVVNIYGAFERWSSSASSGSVGLGYDNRPGELILAYRNRHSS
ncbi:hypothetical protein PIB30_039572 [Stylosanthes scabra]|uniref:Uncharacterized protein n=1 Tax=Stylosanthes scabra TaxID=79078 RepID=A0ABU6VCY6_9FABA|nr:hypothetical protein [Stylosanthes scabra]